MSTVIPLNPQNTSRIAQSFYCNKQYGMYVTDIELFFAEVPATSGEPVYVTLRTLTSGAPEAETYMAKAERTYSEIAPNVSADGTTPTRFSFPHPVYLDPFTSYAFVVETNSAAYKLWFSEIYDYTLNSTEKLVDKNPVTGSLFLSQNGVTYTPVQEQDLKFRIYKANWSNHYTQGSPILVKLQNKALAKKLLVNNPIRTNGTNNIFFLDMPNHGFQEGDEIDISGVTSTSNYIGGIHIDNINSDTAGVLTIASGSTGDKRSRDWTGVRVIAASSNSNGTTDIGYTSAQGGGSSVLADRNYLYTQMVATVDRIVPLSTEATYGVKTTTAGRNPYNAVGGSYTRDTGYSQIYTNKTTKFRKEPRIIASPSTEVNGNTGAIANSKTLEVVVSMATGAPEDVMPVVDTQRMNVAVQAPVIDNPSDATNDGGFNKPLFFVPETAANGGTAAAKHITTVFPLESSAIGLKVLLGGYRPSVAGIDLYYRVGLEGDNLFELPWVYQNTENNPPSDEDERTFRQYEYLIGGSTGIDPFDQFQFKIVFTTQNILKVPRVRDFRAIALGT